MRHFLVDASLPRLVADVIRSHGYQATDVRDVGLTTADDGLIAAHSQIHGLCLMTRDQDFGNIRDYPPADYHGIVVINTSEFATRFEVANLVEQFLKRTEIVDALAGHLAIVDARRVRVRVRPPLESTLKTSHVHPLPSR